MLRDQAAAREVKRLWAFFNSHGGQYQEFFLRDAANHAVARQAFGTGDGVTTTFQLCRTMAPGAISFTEPVFDLVGTPTIIVNGLETSAFTIGSYGQIVFTSRPAAGATLP